MHRHRFAWTWAAPLCLLATSGCATELNDGFGGAGGQGASTATGEGGQGASSASTTSQASTTTGGACAQDCSAVPVPPCYESVCNAMTGTCELTALADGATCEDGLYCTVDDTCDGGLCQSGTARVCDPGGDPCNGASCDESADACVETPLPNGSPCTSANPCMVNAICQNGTCLGAPKDCSGTPVPNECQVAICDPMQNGACVPQIGNDGLACSSFGDPCMVQKVCSAGDCVGGVPKDCSAFTNGCNNGTCEPTTGNCFSQPVPPGGMCNEATDACNIGICQAGGQCIGQPTNEGGMCNDGSNCTVNDVCSAGTCAGTPDPMYTIYFSETFASNSQGWTLGPEWAIGSAQASSCGSSSTGQDPATDHTPTADNGIAGVLIGGCYPTTLHGDYCITSPPFDASGTGSVFLSYYRHLHTDYPNYISSHVDVSPNGSTWTTVYSVPSGQFQNDASWTFFSHDVTAQKSATMQVRFCYSAGPSTAIIVGGGWNVDDVFVASSACP
jgi:hypothetical protein